jgi:uncharacterized membrane protein YraQ (UPF0718 family)
MRDRIGSGDGAVKRAVQFARSESLAVLVITLYGWAAFSAPEKALAALATSISTLLSVALVIVSVFLAMGLFGVLVDKQAIGRRLGAGSGFKALVVAAGIGTILVGPVYVIFPLLKAFKEHGARTAVIVTVITAWAVKIPMIPLEIKFLGWEFSLVRIVLTLVAAVILGLVMEPLLAEKTATLPEPGKEAA